MHKQLALFAAKASMLANLVRPVQFAGCGVIQQVLATMQQT
jgi:hypothetical protein